MHVCSALDNDENVAGAALSSSEDDLADLKDIALLSTTTAQQAVGGGVVITHIGADRDRT
jgi:hypothetical protein